MSIAAVDIANSVQKALDSLLGFIPTAFWFIFIYAIAAAIGALKDPDTGLRRS